MDEYNKVNETQLYLLWRNLSVGLLTLVVMMTLGKMSASYLKPVFAVLATAFLYFVLIDNKRRNSDTCMIVPYAMFYSMIVYSFVSILVNVAWMWGFTFGHKIPEEYIFFHHPFVPSLYLCPCFFVTTLIMYMRRNKLQICRNCKIHNGAALVRGKTGEMLDLESKFQLGNLTFLFGMQTAVVYFYYFFTYVSIAINARDSYIFTWFVVITFFLDEIYFIFRYYNLYLDLKENDEIISAEDVSNKSATACVRIYLICDNYLYADNHALDPQMPFREQTDTPFITRRSVEGLNMEEVRHIIEKMTGYRGGELKFFFGRTTHDAGDQTILRYFYFLDGTPEDYPDIRVSGEWMDFNKIKAIYAQTPGRLTRLFLADISRLATIVITELTFNENGFRKHKLKSYSPNFNLIDVRTSTLDFQDDKWIRISNFNSDTSFYRLKRWWRGISGTKNRGGNISNTQQWRN